MGNAGSSSTNNHRQKSSDLSTPNSPFREINAIHGAGASQTYDAWDKKDTRSVLHGSSQEDDDDTNSPYYTCRGGIGVNNEYNSVVGTRKRASTVSETGVTNSSNLLSSRDVVNKSISNISCKDKGDNKEDGEEENMSDHQKSRSQSQSEDNKNAGLPTVLRWDGGGKNVMISGTFSKWKPIPMVRSHGNFVTIIDLPEGDHQYKFCVDGEWKHDPKVKCIENDEGEKNNLVSVRQSDFEVFQALAKDSEANATQTEKEYTQEVPQVKPWEKVSGPPVLPPHLLQVILNKDTPLSCEPTLLPEPNHVMLNHLYALSIKDGVMVLSATHRYRKKYVTTLLYKPI